IDYFDVRFDREDAMYELIGRAPWVHRINALGEVIADLGLRDRFPTLVRDLHKVRQKRNTWAHEPPWIETADLGQSELRSFKLGRRRSAKANSYSDDDIREMTKEAQACSRPLLELARLVREAQFSEQATVDRLIGELAQKRAAAEGL